MTLIAHFVCICKRKKTFELTFDGGSSGKYILELCRKCRLLESDEYLLKEIMI